MAEKPWWRSLLESMAANAPPPQSFVERFPDKALLTLEEAAPLLGYKNVVSFRRALRADRIPVKHVQLHRRKFIVREDLINYLWYSRRSG